MADNFDFDSDSDMSEFSGFTPSDIDSDLDTSFNANDDVSDNSVNLDHLDNLLREPGNPENLWTDNFTTPTIRHFTEDAGPNLPDGFDTTTASPLQYFLQLFPMDLIQHITTKTNSYAEWKMSQPGANFDNKWYDVTLHEMRAFLAINILMGINEVAEADMYWDSNDLFGNTGVMRLMTCNRFQKIMQYLHVSERADEPTRGQPGYDKLFKIKPVLETVSETFQRSYTLSREVSVDEAMIAFSGRLSFRQYLPKKPIKRGIKVWMMCDANSAYLSHFDVYLGRQPDLTGHGLGHNVVMKLTESLRHSNRRVYFDNYFTGIPLMENLLERGLYACGTVRMNRKGFPQALKKPAGVRNRGDFKVLQKVDTNLTASVWKDNKLVCHLSTLSDPQIIMPARRQSGSDVLDLQHPHSVYSYNKFMGGVDVHDHFRATYDVGRNGKKSWRYLFWFLLNCSIVNAYIIYNSVSTRITKRKRFTQLEFRKELITQLIGGFNRKRKRSPSQIARGPLVETAHINGHVNIRMDGKRRRCKYHARFLNQRKGTDFGCSICNVHLCRNGCHARYHNHHQ